MTNDNVLLAARARVLRDMTSHGVDTARAVDILDEVLSERRWWIEQWPEGSDYVDGQVAQDVQDRMLDAGLGRWPRCTSCDETQQHELRIEPELGPEPRWICEKAGITVAPLGSLT
ncbi:hypothetical protein EF847_01170 [Actinobacteria bacterium YIM 96077]|uniref:Uncharacterized protein n=1 Tax=Phytoactinopolyspora halophila TaxID=1981511 RepID=A0A329R1Z2_9ACTN|nr:hypothetical protein [Phytoactinopolyspora halophila]AYY11537.1 hypothetical protein EF847_01170 [Actinobacteria bacterium YIM 96077]RAW17979.1 hypothetical protein DPM12_03835 [Phytoactinopolyspora halophila]